MFFLLASGEAFHSEFLLILPYYMRSENSSFCTLREEGSVLRRKVAALLIGRGASCREA